LNDELNGFGRIFYISGNYYIGEIEDHKIHGKGKFVYYDGRIEDGIWKYGEFIG
jgi:hypothetical protein